MLPRRGNTLALTKNELFINSYHITFHPTPSILASKMKEKDKCWRDYRKTGIAGGSVNWCSCSESNLEHVPNVTKTEIHRYHPQALYPRDQRKRTKIFRAILFVVANSNWKLRKKGFTPFGKMAKLCYVNVMNIIVL